MRKPRRSSPHVNLLPLLDVLLCTMGTLIVVLGFLNRGEKSSSDSERRFSFSNSADAAADEELADTSIVHQHLQLRVEKLTNAREKTTADLNAARQQLGRIEEDSRRIKRQIEDLQAAAKQLPDADAAAANLRDSLRTELMRLNTERMRLEAEIGKSRNDGKYRKPAYAIVPFDGRYKTQRRPVYIECRGDSIIIQPEGIEFNRNDFIIFNGPGNPLAAAIRAAQEYWSQQPRQSPETTNEPYPLFLVRPDGIIAYRLANAVVSEWTTEFGYELIEADRKLEFPQQFDPRLVEMERRAVADSRQKQQALAEILRERVVRQQTTKYYLNPTGGGLIREGGLPPGNNPFARDPLGGFGKSGNADTRAALGSGGAGRNGPGGFGNADRGTDEFGATAGRPGGTTWSGDGPGGFGAGSDSGNSMFGAADGMGAYGPGTPSADSSNRSHGDFASGGGGSTNGNRSSGGSGDLPSGQTGFGGNQPMYSGVGSRYGNSASGPSLIGDGLQGGTADRGNNSGGGQPNQFAENSMSTGNGVDRSAMGGSNGSATAAQAGDQGAANDGVVGGDAAHGGSAMASGGSPGTSGNRMPGASNSGGGQGQSSGAEQLSMSEHTTQATQPTASQSLAAVRGRNWALPSDSHTANPITRSIRLECWPDRIVVMPDSRDGQPQVIPLQFRTEESIDKVVGAVREHSRRWGIAGRGMYWKPQLVLHVNPNSKGRADDLQVLLANSGLDVKRK